jgi:hypothetical protein
VVYPLTLTRDCNESCNDNTCPPRYHELHSCIHQNNVSVVLNTSTKPVVITDTQSLQCKKYITSCSNFDSQSLQSLSDPDCTHNSVLLRIFYQIHTHTSSHCCHCIGSSVLLHTTTNAVASIVSRCILQLLFTKSEPTFGPCQAHPLSMADSNTMHTTVPVDTAL